jgi:hypothetical protein
LSDMKKPSKKSLRSSFLLSIVSLVEKSGFLWEISK